MTATTTKSAWRTAALPFLFVFGLLITGGNALAQTGDIEVGGTLEKDARKCIGCHRDSNPGIVHGWRESQHAHAGVSCIDCHQVPEDAEYGYTHADIGMEGGMYPKMSISVLVSPGTCGRCHAQAKEEFDRSGHYRAYRQIIPKDSLHALTQVHEGRGLPELNGAPWETGCMQCHGTEIELDEIGRPTPETWPNAGMGNVYPDGSVGNCTACHTRHRFSIAESRKPAACASCHLGPDHPNIEIFNNSKHGHVFNAEGHEWKFTAAPNEWLPGDYRAPTCATCHMSGLGDQKATHDINERLYWNLWAKRSEVRTSRDVMSPLLGYGDEGRENMKGVCSECHTRQHTDGFFAQGDKAVKLYNIGYFDPAEAMREELAEKGLLKENPWSDEFQLTYYHLWHHEGRRARQGALMGAPDYAHWHGFFELQQDYYKLQDIYNKRLETGKIE